MPTKAQLQDEVDALKIDVEELEKELHGGRIALNRKTFVEGYNACIADIKAIAAVVTDEQSLQREFLQAVTEVLQAHSSECLQLWVIGSDTKDIPPPSIAAHKARH